MEDGQWSWNYPNNDWWNHDLFDTKEEAVADAKENYEVHNENICVGQCYRIPLPTCIDTDMLFEDLDNQYHEDSDDDDFLFEDVTKEQGLELEDELEKVLKKFYKKINLQSPSWSVNHIETVYVD